MRALFFVVAVLLPGGLLVFSAFLLARLLVQRMRLESGTQGHRLSRAMATIRLRDVVAEARQGF